MTDKRIIDKILVHLQGYVLDTEAEQGEYNDLEYDKKISENEITSFYELTISYTLSYLQLAKLPSIIVDDAEVTNPVVQDAICMWTAGKIWQKYNVRVNNNEDETNTLGYGDKLVIQAKEILKPYKYYKMMVY